MIYWPSYINTILIQSCGNIVLSPYTTCQGLRSGLRLFPECRCVLGHFGGCCGNCKWRNYTSKCSVRDNNIVEILSDENENPSKGKNQLQIEAGVNIKNTIILA